jgi:hypothetical protein
MGHVSVEVSTCWCLMTNQCEIATGSGLIYCIKGENLQSIFVPWVKGEGKVESVILRKYLRFFLKYMVVYSICQMFYNSRTGLCYIWVLPVIFSATSYLSSHPRVVTLLQFHMKLLWTPCHFDTHWWKIFVLKLLLGMKQKSPWFHSPAPISPPKTCPFTLNCKRCKTSLPNSEAQLLSIFLSLVDTSIFVSKQSPPPNSSSYSPVYEMDELN